MRCRRGRNKSQYNRTFAQYWTALIATQEDPKVASGLAGNSKSLIIQENNNNNKSLDSFIPNDADVGVSICYSFSIFFYSLTG